MNKRLVALLVVLECAGTGTAATPAFLGRRDYPGGGSRVTIADTNGDKIPDILSLTGSAITVWLGNGGGTFGQPTKTQIAMYGTADFAAADLNGDGKVDLIVSGGLNGTGIPQGVGVCFGNGDGTFQHAVFYQAGTEAFLGSVVLGDFNNDGILDAAAAGYAGVWLFTGKGAGVFNPGVLIPYNGSAPSVYLLDLAAADFDGDGNVDLVVMTTTGFAVLLNNGNGSFRQVSFSTPLPVEWVATGDLNMDGNQDIVVVPRVGPGGTVYVYLGDGSGGFAGPGVAYLPGDFHIAIGDVNGDGIPDLVNSGVNVALGKGDGTFRASVHHTVESPATNYNLALADLRNDGLNDIVAEGAGAVSVLLNGGKGKFQDGNWTAVPGAGNCGAAADYNRDGKPDLALPTLRGITILLGTGKAASPFTTGATVPLTSVGCPVTGDLNGDGIPDLLVETYDSQGGGGTMVAYLGNGDGTFTQESSAAISATGYIVLGDFNHDGKLDWAISGNLMALGNGDGTFQAPVPFAASPPLDGFLDIAAGDLNGDGFSDLVLTNYEENGLYVLLNNHHGGFTESVITNSYGPLGVVLADLNKDGKLDAVVWMYYLSVAQVYLGNGKGGFTLVTQTIDYPLYPDGPLAVADVNGDGIPDLLLQDAGSIAIFLGKGNGAFRPSVVVGGGPAPGFVFTENLHGQPPTAGLPDIVLPDATGGVTVLINATK
jgi:hypothetical protein